MRIFKLFLLLSLVVWAEFKLDVSNENTYFYKEVANVFAKPLYRSINSSSFEDMNGSEMSVKMKESIEAFLPIYLNTKSPLCTNHKNYPTIEIQRFFKVLNKYIEFLEFKHKDKKIYTILEKRLSDAYDCIQNASSILDLLFGMSYYENILDFSKCNHRISSQLVRTKCDNTKMRLLLEKYNVPNQEYFFKVLEEERKQNINSMIEAIKEEGISKKNIDIFFEKFTKYTQYYYVKYGKKLKDTVKANSSESLDEYKTYIDTEFTSMQSVESIAKTFLSNTLVKIQKLLSIEDKYYGNIIDYRLKSMSLLMFTGYGSTYQQYQNFLIHYNERLKSCHQND